MAKGRSETTGPCWEQNSKPSRPALWDVNTGGGTRPPKTVAVDDLSLERDGCRNREIGNVTRAEV